MTGKDLKKLIKKGESETLEFKENFGDGVIESLIALANTKGGKVIIGISDQFRVIGIVLGKETLPHWLNEIKNKTYPSIFPDA